MRVYKLSRTISIPTYITSSTPRLENIWSVHGSKWTHSNSTAPQTQTASCPRVLHTVLGPRRHVQIPAPFAGPQWSPPGRLRMKKPSGHRHHGMAALRHLKCCRATRRAKTQTTLEARLFATTTAVHRQLDLAHELNYLASTWQLLGRSDLDRNLEAH